MRIIHLLLSKESVDRYKSSFVGNGMKFLIVNTFELSNFGYNCSGQLEINQPLLQLTLNKSNLGKKPNFE